MAQSNVLQRNGGGAAEKGAEEGPDATGRGSLQLPTVRDEGLAEILHQASYVEFLTGTRGCQMPAPATQSRTEPNRATVMSSPSSLRQLDVLTPLTIPHRGRSIHAAILRELADA
jgi:hypothetical protein